MSEAELHEALFPDGIAPQDELERLTLEIEEQQRAYGELESQLKRLAADFENYRRRQAIEREELTKYAGCKLLEGFLPMIDNFERAIQAGRNTPDPAKIQQGIELIYRQMVDFLTRHGVKPLACVGNRFDPNLHEAIGQIPTEEHSDQTVIYEVERGYMFFDRILRYAKVQVAYNPNESIETAVDPEGVPDGSGEQKEEQQNG